MSIQVTPRRDSFKQAATARRLNNVRAIAHHVLNSTIYDERITEQVKRCKAGESFIKGRAFVANGQHFYLVASKFAHRFYVVVFNKRTQQYQCSASDEAVAIRCIKLVRQHLSSLKVA